MACVFYAIAVHSLVVGRGNALFRSSNTTLYRALAGWLAGWPFAHSLSIPAAAAATYINIIIIMAKIG